MSTVRPSSVAGVLSATRCPACGQRVLEPASTSCSLCGFSFGDDDRATGSDVTPYAAGYAQGTRGWRAMCVWVWLAKQQRLKHLALTRASAASRCFSRWNILVLAFGFALFQATRVGWCWVRNSSVLDAQREPLGGLWVHAASTPSNFLPGLAPEVAVDLWWNPVQAVVAVATGACAGVLLLWLTLALARVGTRLAHQPRYRQEQRMTAALHYGTAWVVPMTAGALLASLRFLSYIGAIARWTWYPSQRGLELAGAVVAAFGVVLCWFWLLRAGATAPAPTRRRVSVFLAVGAPMIACAAGLGWWFGLDQVYKPMFRFLGVNF